MKLEDKLKYIRWLLSASVLATVIIAASLVVFISGVRFSAETNGDSAVAQVVDDPVDIKDGIHVATGLIDSEGLQVVIASCTACHSAKLITQNRATREGWVSMIRWMQATQNLWDLGESEELIVTYLATNYAPTKKGRRANLKDIEWYDLEE